MTEIEELRARVERLERENARLQAHILNARKRLRADRETLVSHVQTGVAFSLRGPARDVPLSEVRFLARMGARGWEEEARWAPPGTEGEGKLLHYSLTPVWRPQQPAEERQALLPLGKPAPAAPLPQAPAPAAEKPKRTRKPRKPAVEGATT